VSWVWKSAVALVVYFGVGGGMTFAGLAWLHLRTRGEESGVPGPELSCGCPKDSRPTYTRLGCDDKRCGEHREQHEHGADRAVTEQTCVINAAGLSKENAEVLRRNYSPMSEEDRSELNITFLSIVNGADR
jgi:hypothetical protein